MKQPATKQDIARRLKRLSVMMANLSNDMMTFGCVEYDYHAGELAGALKNGR